jgi:hypothetical protein
MNRGAMGVVRRSVTVALTFTCICLAAPKNNIKPGTATITDVPYSIKSDGYGSYVDGTSYILAGIVSRSLILDTNTANSLPLRTVNINFSNPAAGSPPSPLASGKYDVRLIATIPPAVYSNTPVIASTKIIIAPANNTQYTLEFPNAVLTWDGQKTWVVEVSAGNADLYSLLLRGKSSAVYEGSYGMTFRLTLVLN